MSPLVADAAWMVALKEGAIFRIVSRLLLLTLVALVALGCATPSTGGHPGQSNRAAELRATRVLDRHRARRGERCPQGRPVVPRPCP